MKTRLALLSIMSIMSIMAAGLLNAGCGITMTRQAAPTPTLAPPLPATPAAKPTEQIAPSNITAQPPAAPPATPVAQGPAGQPTPPSSPIAAAKPKNPVAGTAVPPTAPPTVAPTAAPAACTYGQARKLAQVEDRALREASALVASTRYPGVYWTLNDSGNTPTIYALDEQGKSRGTFRVNGAENEDWEAIQLGPGRDGTPALYIGDIGDNDQRRKEIQIYRVPEPDLGQVGGRPPSGRTGVVEAFRLTYPDGAHDAEAMLVHPTTGELLIVTKEVPGRASVYKAPLPLTPGRPVGMELVAKLDLAKYGIKADVVDDAAITADARRVTLRTYGSGVEYDVPAGATLASIWGQTPRVFKIQDPPQGEGISYRLDGGALLTIGEDSPAFLWVLPRQC